MLARSRVVLALLGLSLTLLLGACDDEDGDATDDETGDGEESGGW